MLSNYYYIKHRNYLSYMNYFSCRGYGVLRKCLTKECFINTAFNKSCDCSSRKSIFGRFLISSLFAKTRKNFNVQIGRLIYKNEGKQASVKCKKFISSFVLASILFHGPFNLVHISWFTFVEELLSKGQVEEIIVVKHAKKILAISKRGAIVNNEEIPFKRYFVIDMINFDDFEEELKKAEDKLGILHSNRVSVHYEENKINPIIIYITIMLLVYAILKRILTVNFFKIRGQKFSVFDPASDHMQKVKFSDVAGLQEAKMEVMEFTDYLKRPEHYTRLGAKTPKGALLLGPPGCGKTLLAKAVASEANVPFLLMNGSEFMELVGGLGAARVRELFSKARKMKPCIVYIDEIDSFGKKRFSNNVIGGDSESDNTLNQLLVEMDGMASTQGVITLASTNRAELLDVALLRPGRFDRHILIDLPNVEERREIFLVHLKNLRLEHEPKNYAKRLASLTPGFSGADIANICNEAALHAARFKKTFVSGKDLDYAVERIIGGVEKRSSALSTKEKHVAAYHEAGCALIGWLTEHGDILLKISVVPRTNLTVGWTQFSPTEKYLFSKEELFGKMCMTLGGRAAETIIFNIISTKSKKDLRKVTKIAYAQVRHYGMNNLIGPISFAETENRNVKPYSRQLAGLIDEESRKLIAKAYFTAETVLRENKDKLVKLAEELVKRETMNYEEVVAVIGPPKFADKKTLEPIAFDMAINAAAGLEPMPKDKS